MYLDYAELQASKGVVMVMREWIEKLNAFLSFNEQAILEHSGKVSHEVAKALAEQAFDQYSIEQDRLYESDFDRLLQLKR